MAINLIEIIKEWFEINKEFTQSLYHLLFEFKINCEWCDSELPEDSDPCEWDGCYFCSEECLKEYLKDGE